MISFFRVRRATLRLATMLSEGRFREVARLAYHRGRAALLNYRQRRASASRHAVAIDARTERLDGTGHIVAKRAFVFPDSAARKASIVIPCYNYGAYLGEAVASARSQTLADVEIIVVDDGSTDPATVALLDRLEAEPDLTVIRKPNGGLASARNAGIEAASGEYVCCLDADDRLLPTYLEAAVLVAEADRAVGFAYSWVRLFGDEDGTWQTRDFNVWQALQDNHTAVCAVFRRDDWLAAGGYDGRMREGYEDWEFWLRLANLGRRGKVIHAPLFEHRRHGHTMTHDAHSLRQRLMDRMRELNPELFASARRQALVAGVRPAPNAGPAALTVGVRHPPGADKPHLLVIVPWLQSGGAEMVLLDMLRGLGEAWRITLLTTLHDDHPSWSEFFAVTDDIFAMASAFAGESGLALALHLARSRGTSVVFASGSSWFYENAARLRRALPSVALLDLLHNALPEGHLASAAAASAAIDTHVVVAPHIGQALVRHGVAPAKVEVIVNGVEPSGARLDPARRAAARAALGLSPQTFSIGWVGRYAPEKAPLDFVRAVAALPDRAGVAAFMCGDGPLAGEVAAALGAAPVTMLDRRPREAMPDLYAAFDVLVLTSMLEGLPLVVMEALGAGCPVIATDVGEVALQIRDGENGRLIAPGDVAGLAAAIESLRRTPEAGRAVLAENAHRSIADGPFALDRMRTRYADLLAAAAARKDGTPS